jgi:ABC-type cobalamin/Fe3+-siderophores transport system ATPase subunit
VEDGVTAEEAVAAARYRHREGAARRREKAREALDGLGLGAFADRPMRALSGGEAQRVRLAALVAQEAAWWLLDEPMNHLDPAVRLELCDVLGGCVAAGTSVVVVSHDLALLPHLGDAWVVVLRDGLVVHEGEARDPALLAPLGEAFRLRLHRVELDGGWALVARP